MMTKKSRANPQMPVPAVGALDLPCQRHDVTSQHFVRLDEQLCDNPLISLLPESPNQGCQNIENFSIDITIDYFFNINTNSNIKKN